MRFQERRWFPHTNSDFTTGKEMSVVQGQKDEAGELNIVCLYLILTAKKNTCDNYYEKLTTYFITICNGSEHVGKSFQFLFLYV